MIPTPKTTLGRAAERAVLLAISAGIASVMQDVKVTPFAYLILKTALDVLNSNIPNL